MTDYSFEISSSTPGVNSVTLVPGNSGLTNFSLNGVSVSDSQLDFSTANSSEFDPFNPSVNQESSLCVTNALNPFNSSFFSCRGSQTNEQGQILLSGNEIFTLHLGAGSDNFATGSFANFPQQIDAANSAAVPFEFSPSLGLILIDGVWGISRYRKSRKAKNLMENNQM